MPRPKKTDVARFKAMQDLGMSNFAIGRQLGFDAKTIKHHLDSMDFSDPELRAMIEKIKDAEINQLHVIGQRAREILLGYLSDVIEGKREPNIISVIAALDRTFQQRQLLTGKSTMNVSVFARVVEAACEDNQDIGTGEDRKGK